MSFSTRSLKRLYVGAQHVGDVCPRVHLGARAVGFGDALSQRRHRRHEDLRREDAPGWLSLPFDGDVEISMRAT